MFVGVGYFCGNPALGDAGVRCVNERLVRGGTAPWCPSPDHRGCDYLTSTRDPIANDLAVVPDPMDTAAASVLSSVGINPDQPIGAGGAPLKSFLFPAALLAIGAVWVLGSR